METRTSPHPQSPPAIGIDIGRVIIGAADPTGKADTSFLSGPESRAIQTPPTDGAFEGVRTLVERFSGRAWLVSKCGPRIEALTRRWLDAWGFFASTGLDREHLRFCRERSEKAEHARRLRLTAFVDDRVDVLGHLTGTVPALYLFGHQKAGTDVPVGVTPVLTWAEAVATIRALTPAEIAGTSAAP